MVTLDVVLRNLAFVFLRFLRQKVRGVGFLQKRIALVLFIRQDALDRGGVPFFLARGCRDALIRESPAIRVGDMPVRKSP